MSISPRFKLRDPNSSGKTSIVLFFYLNGNRIKYGTSLKIYPDLWFVPKDDHGNYLHADARPSTKKSDLARYRADNPHIEAEILAVRNTLDKIRSELFNLFQRKINPSEDEIRELLNSICKPSSNKERKLLELNDFVEQFIQEIQTGVRLIDSGKSKGQRFAPSTVKLYREWFTQFRNFQGKKKYRFKDITMDFYDKYVKFFTDKNYSANSVGKHIKILKALMRIAYDDGLHENQEFARKRFRTIKQESDSTYLNESEIRKIFSLNLQENPDLILIRDVWLCGYWSAQRYSDYSRLSPEHFRFDENGNLILDMITRKTRERTIVPVKPEFEETMRKYNFKLPKSHEQKVNKGIKIIGQMAGIDENVTISETKGGIPITRSVPKYQLICTHTARRSMITQLFKNGVPSTSIMKISGHRSEKSLLTYLRITKEENANILAQHPFFRTRMLKTAK